MEEGFLHICCETVYSYDYYGLMTDNSEGVYGFLAGCVCIFIFLTFYEVGLFTIQILCAHIGHYISGNCTSPSI